MYVPSPWRLLRMPCSESVRMASLTLFRETAERFGKLPLGGQLIPHLEPALFDSILYFLGKPLICLEGFPCFGKRFSLLRLVWSLL